MFVRCPVRKEEWDARRAVAGPPKRSSVSRLFDGGGDDGGGGGGGGGGGSGGGDGAQRREAVGKMASDNEASCASDPNFAVICSFLNRFGKSCGIVYPDIARLQEMLENAQEGGSFTAVSPFTLVCTCSLSCAGGREGQKTRSCIYALERCKRERERVREWERKRGDERVCEACERKREATTATRPRKRPVV